MFSWRQSHPLKPEGLSTSLGPLDPDLSLLPLLLLQASWLLPEPVEAESQSWRVDQSLSLLNKAGSTSSSTLSTATLHRAAAFGPLSSGPEGHTRYASGSTALWKAPWVSRMVIFRVTCGIYGSPRNLQGDRGDS